MSELARGGERMLTAQRELPLDAVDSTADADALDAAAPTSDAATVVRRAGDERRAAAGAVKRRRPQ